MNGMLTRSRYLVSIGNVKPQPPPPDMPALHHGFAEEHQVAGNDEDTSQY